MNTAQSEWKYSYEPFVGNSWTSHYNKITESTLPNGETLFTLTCHAKLVGQYKEWTAAADYANYRDNLPTYDK